MPSSDITGHLKGQGEVYGVGTTLMKRHKILPHPPEEPVAYDRPSTPDSKQCTFGADTEHLPIHGSVESSPHTLRYKSRRTGVPDLPPTPPAHSRRSSATHPNSKVARLYDDGTMSARDPLPVPTTPLHNRSPPTPDVTPPKTRPQFFRATTSDRYASSRAESFETARENPDTSDDEDAAARRARSTLRPSAISHVQRKHNWRTIGLGLGMESDRGPVPTQTNKSRAELENLEGEWGADADVCEVEREWDDNLMRNVIVRKTRPANLHTSVDGAADDIVRDHTFEPPRSTLMAQRIARHRLERGAPNRIVSEPIRSRFSTSTTTDEPVSPGTRRLSAMSSKSVSSTVVEAIVVDALPQRQRTLRHMKKQLGLRSISSDQSALGSNTEVISSNQPCHRPVHKGNRIPERRHRSLNLNSTVSTVSSEGRSRKQVLRNGGIPVVVIPERRSSSKTREPSLRSTSSRKTARSMSVGSAPLTKSSDVNNLSFTPKGERAPSDPADSGNSVRTMDSLPVDPLQRPTLLAPTSQYNSRAGSLTAGSLKTHNTFQEKHVSKLSESPPLHLSEEDSKNFLSLRVDTNGDPFFGKRPSAQATPFSQSSHETAGTAAEVSEAMAIPLYPHHNNSVLMIQHEPSPLPRRLSLGTADPYSMYNPRMKINSGSRPTTPPFQPINSNTKDSPLRNPRAPPAPPTIKCIPPTPSTSLSPASDRPALGQCDFEEHLAALDATSANTPRRSLSLFRNAFSNRRRYSESHIPSPIKRNPSLRSRDSDGLRKPRDARSGVGKGYPSVLDQPRDESKLHPFWRPTSFWNDLEGVYDEDLYNSDGPYGYDSAGDYASDMGHKELGKMERSLSGKLRRTFAVLPSSESKDRRRSLLRRQSSRGENDRWTYAVDRRTVRKSSSGSLRVVRRRSSSDLTSNMAQENGSNIIDFAHINNGSGVVGYRNSYSGETYVNALPKRKGHIIPGLGISVHYIGFKGVRNRLSEKLGEKRRERRREDLRRMIGAPVDVRGGIDGGLIP